MVSGKEQRNQCQERHDRKQFVVAAEQTPGRSRISPVNEFKKSRDDHLFLITWEDTQHDPLRNLVKQNHQQCDERDATIWGSKEYTYWFHLPGATGFYP